MRDAPPDGGASRICPKTFVVQCFHMEVRLTFANFGYSMEGYITTMSTNDLGRWNIGEREKYEKEIRRVYATRSSVSTGQNKISVRFVSSGREYAGFVSTAEVLQLLGKQILENSSNEDYTFLQHNEVKRVIGRVDEVQGCLYLRWSSDGKVRHSLRQHTANLVQRCLSEEAMVWDRPLVKCTRFYIHAWRKSCNWTAYVKDTIAIAVLLFQRWHSSFYRGFLHFVDTKLKIFM